MNSIFERLIRIHRVNVATERRMNKLLRICVTAETPEMRRQYTNAYAHMIAVRIIRHRVAYGETSNGD